MAYRLDHNVQEESNADGNDYCLNMGTQTESDSKPHRSMERAHWPLFVSVWAAVAILWPGNKRMLQLRKLRHPFTHWWHSPLAIRDRLNHASFSSWLLLPLRGLGASSAGTHGSSMSVREAPRMHRLSARMSSAWSRSKLRTFIQDPRLFPLLKGSSIV